jgi:hypothetical protein
VLDQTHEEVRAVRYVCLILLLALGACDEPRTEAKTENEEPAFAPKAVPVTSAQSARAITGIATLVSPDALAQLNADLSAAEIAANFSARTLTRYQDTKSLPVHSVDNAERQLATDRTQLALLKLKLRNTWGDTAPFVDARARQQLVDELSSGRTTLVRLDFPRAVEQELTNVRVRRLGGGEETVVSSIWAAPSGSLAMPGTSFYGLMPAGPGLRPGDRAHVTAEGEAATSGVVIPASAVVVYESASWCYVEEKPGVFVRKPVTLAQPVDDGYLVTDFKPDTKVVVQGASVLLSREAEPVLGDDDDDDGGHRPAARRTSVPVASSDPD